MLKNLMLLLCLLVATNIAYCQTMKAKALDTEAFERRFSNPDPRIRAGAMASPIPTTNEAINVEVQGSHIIINNIKYKLVKAAKTDTLPDVINGSTTTRAKYVADDITVVVVKKKKTTLSPVGTVIVITHNENRSYIGIPKIHEGIYIVD